MSGGSNESATPRRDGDAAAVAALRDAVAELNDLVLFGDLDDEQARDLTGQLAELNRQAQLSSGKPLPTSGPGQAESWGDYRRRSPFAGTANPRSPGLRMRIDTDAPVPTAQGAVTVGAAFAGPPGVVHGGIIAGLLDEAIGWLAAATVPDAAVVTGKLSVRFHAPTLVAAPLDLQVAVIKRTRHIMTLEASISVGATRTASGEALMVIKR